MNFPTIAAPNTLTEQWEDIGMSSPMEDGSEISRARFTKSRGTWVIGWNCLPTSDYATLVNFYKTQCKGKAVVFDWTNPLTETTYHVRMVVMDAFSAVSTVGYSGTITLRES